MDHDVNGLLSLVEKVCTLGQVQDLLRAARDRAEKGQRRQVRVTAQDKAGVVHGNLREALKQERIDVAAVYDLIRKAEENGDQHVFYFRPRKVEEMRQKLTIDAIGRALIGQHWRQQVPNTIAPEGEFGVTDLRTFPDKPSDWLLKFYGIFNVEHARAERVVINGKPYLPLEEVPERHVLIVRWNHPNLLELRVGRDSSRRRIEERFQFLWTALGAVVDQPDFEWWDLSPARHKLIELKDEKDSKLAYACRDTRLVDSNGGARYSLEGNATAYDTLEREEVQRFVRSVLAAGDQCTHLSVKWLEREGNTVPSRELHTIIGGKEKWGEIVVAGKCEAADVDYVTERLRQFSRSR